MTGPLDFGEEMNAVLRRADPYENLRRSAEQQADSDPNFSREFGDVIGAARGKAPALIGDDLALAAAKPTGTVNLMRSAGPISDQYILSTAPVSLIIGPGGSGKTIASCKKSLVEAQRMRPGPDGVRRYVLGAWRQKYVNLWKATIPSWWKVFPRTLGKFEGSSPREAQHVIPFRDAWGDIEITVRFRAFGESMDPEDVLGNEFTDCLLNEWPTLPEDLFIALVDRVGRDPPREISGRTGRFFGDGNAPDVQHYTYRDFFETPKPGYRLFRQPSGLSPEAENIEAVGRDYYLNSANVNSHRPWWIKRMIHAQPGFTRANMPCWPEWNDDRNMARAAIPVIKELPVIWGIDGGLTARAVAMQERGDGQLRWLAETSIERGGMRELATRMLAIEASPRFAGCTFVDSCDPAMLAGEDTEEGSDRARLSEYLGRDVKPAPTQNPDARHEAVRAKLRHTCENGEPGLLVDPSCKTLRRGANQTFHFKTIAGSDDVGNVAKTLDGHTCEAGEYGALLCGSALARKRADEIARARRARQDKNRDAKRYNPLGRRRA